MLVVAAEQLQPEKVVAGDEALNLVKDGPGIEGGELRLEIVGGKPYRVTISLAGLRATALTHVGAKALAEGNERLYVGTHLVGDADDHLEVGADAGAVTSLGYLLEIAVAVGHGTGFLVEVGCGKDDIGQLRGLCEEHLLHDNEGVLEGDAGSTLVAGDGIGVDDIEG